MIIIPCLLFTGCEDENNKPQELSSDLRNCLKVNTGDNTLDIVTWNVHDFPIKGKLTIDRLASMVVGINADIFAFQEIKTSEDFNKLMEILPGYEGFIDISSGQNLAFLLKKDEIKETGNIESIFEDETYLFPRPPLVIPVTDKTGNQITLINIHLKCCEGAENEYRRQSAIENLKNYIDTSLADVKVILLGDFNDEINDASGRNIFSVFINDSLDFRIADLQLAAGNSSDWSYPSWPSHLDHFIISNELYNYYYSVSCLKPDFCDSLYFSTISDHRPVLLQIKY